MRALVGVEQAIDRQDKFAQSEKLWQIAKHLTEPASFAAVEVFGPTDDQMPMLPDEVGLLLLRFALTGAGSFLRFAQTTASPSASAGASMPTTQTPDRVKDTIVDVLDDMEDAELVAGVRPDLGQQFGVEVGAIGDHDFWGKAVIFEVFQEAAHVVLVVGGN